MKVATYQEALDAYANPFHEFTVELIGEGLINHSYKVTSKVTGGSFLLQEINQAVFPKPGILQSNYELLWNYLRSENIPFVIPQPKSFVGDTNLFYDSRDNCWRIFEFMSGAQTFAIAEKASQAKAVAKTFAGFTASFATLDIDLLQVTIPGFHNLSSRFKQFQQSLHSRQLERLLQSAEIIDDLKKREKYANFYDVLTESEAFPIRVMHHDAKIGNVLFNEETGQVICPVDLDTVMPGYYFSDLGDMIRSMACSEDENSAGLDRLFIRKDFYEDILEGYLQVMDAHLTASEKKYIHFTGLLMIYMQALRFLTDYLHGDVYYKVTHPEQNMDRAKNQLVLLKRLEEFLKEEYQLSI
jgi:thiamine kinase-like enzyme